MTDSMTNNDLDSYGVWVKRSGKTNEPAPVSHEAEISDFGMDVNNAENETVVQESFETHNVMETPDDDSPFVISDDTIAALDEPIRKDELSAVSDNLGFAADEISEESSEAEMENMLAENIPADIDISSKDESDASLVTDEDGEMSAPVFEDSMFEAVDDTSSFEADEISDSDDTDFAAADVSEQSSVSSTDSSALQQIMSELADLKSEIAILKMNFEELKNKPVSDFSASVGDDLETTSSAGGFFSDDDEDETISLSGDELSNIMSSANFSEPEIVGDDEQMFDEMAIASGGTGEIETPQFDGSFQSQEESLGIEESVVDDMSSEEIYDTANEMEDLSVDVANFDDEEVIEESDDDIDVDETVSLDDMAEFSSATGIIADDNLPDEISVSKIDDVMVDSSDDDFLDVQETDVADDISGLDFDIPEELPEDTVESERFEESNDFVEEVHLPDDHPAVVDLMSADPEIHESITDNHLDYLKTDENATFEENLGFADVTETEISEHPEDSEVIENSAEIADEAEAPRSFVDDLIDTHDDSSIPSGLKSEIKSVLLYMDQLLESLPEEKIVEFAQSEQFNTYKKLFSDLGLS